MGALLGYTFTDVLRKEGDLILYRGYPDNDRNASVLVVVPSEERPAQSSFLPLENEYGLREQLNLDSVVQPSALLHSAGRMGLVLKDPGGEPLERLLGMPMILTQFLRIAIELTAALGKVHSNGLIHRDIQPANILFDQESGRLWITGFGSAMLAHRERQAAEASDALVGNFAYMSPEQTGRMNRSVDARSDLYSLGVTFYRMLTGVLPFTASDPMEWIHCHVARKPSLPTEHFADIPEPVCAIIMKLLEKAAEHRYQTAFGLEMDLKNCLEQWESSERIEAFQLGLHDLSNQLVIPEKLYGRESEIQLLHEAFERIVSEGTSEYVFVTGSAGVGKSALVKELQRVVSQANGVFCSGKFDQYKRDIPHTIVGQAFQGYIQQILCKSESEVARWREAFNAALGGNAQLMVDLLPELETIIGKQQPVPPLPINEAKKRFQHTFLQLLGVFATPEHPFVLFLDDVQFIDSASLELLESLFTQKETGHFLLITVYRDNELMPGNPVRKVLEKAGKIGEEAPSATLKLKPLSQANIVHLIDETLLCEPQRAIPLVEVIYEKTEGNPFFTTQFLHEIHEEKLLGFDAKQRGWQWDIEAIRAKGFSDNVVDIMLGKLNRLPNATKEILKQIACLGNTVAIDVLPLITGHPLDKIHADLSEAVRAGFLLRSGEAYKFSHDRIQQAAYTLIPEEAKAAKHLRIGRILVSQSTEETVENNLFSILAQLNRGKEIIVEPDEKALFRRLNYRAGRKAKASTAYPTAHSYFSLAAEFATADIWSSDYEAALALYLELLESEYLVGNFERADEVSQLTLNHARNDLDRAKVYSLRMLLYQLTGKLEDAVNTGLQALKLFDIRFPETEEELQNAFIKEKQDISKNMGGRSVAEIVDAPPALDPEIRTIIHLLTDMIHSLAIVRPKSRLNALVVAKIVNFSLIHGGIEKSCFTYANYARMLLVESGDPAAAAEFTELALKLKDKFNLPPVSGPVEFFYGVYLQHWSKHVDTSVATIEQAFKTCFQAGNYVFSGFSAYFLVTHLFTKGKSLEEVFEGSKKYLDFAKQIRNDILYNAIKLYRQVAATLKEPAAGEDSAEDSDLSEAERFDIITKARFAPSIACHFILKQSICFLYERYAEAKQFGESASTVLAPGGIAYANYFFYHALTLIALQRQGDSGKLQETLQALAVPMQKLKLMAECCPENFLDRYTLVCAELADMEEKVLEAQQGYEKAIHAATENGFLQNQALVNELAGKFYLRRGFETIGYAYLREAHLCYQRWGATAKARHLEQHHPRLMAILRADHAAKAGASAENLDVMTIIKASQAMSGEIVLAKVIERLMTIVLENAGAVRGLLILPEGEGYAIAAEAATGHHIDVTLRNSPINSLELPESIFQYVIRTKEKVLLDDALSSGMFAKDDYIVGKRAQSVLFLPLIKQAKLVGVLYLENNLIPGAFTADRITVLELLTSQAAISVENARLYRERELTEEELRKHRDHLEELVKERTTILNQKTNDIEAMLQNMDLGVCTIVQDNRIHPEYSRHLCSIFEETDFAGKNILEALFAKAVLDADVKDQINVALGSIIGEDAMMYEFNSHLLVREMEIERPDKTRKIVQMDWNAITNDQDVIEKVLFISRDVTQLRELEQAAMLQKEELDIISRIIRISVEKFDEFIASAQKFLAMNRTLIQNSKEHDGDAIAALFRNMHTVKGNARTYDFSLIANAAHTAEQYYDQLRNDREAEWNAGRMLEDLQAVEAAVLRFKTINEDKLGRKGSASNLPVSGGVFVANEVLADMKAMVDAATRRQEGAIKALQKTINSLDFLPLDSLISGVVDSLSSLAKELNKPLPEVEIENGGVAFSSQFAEALRSSFMHIVRNCMDHGIEAPEERKRLGKPEQGRIHFACKNHGGRVNLHIRDDGRGLALHKLYEKGIAKGVISPGQHLAREAVAELIFHSGLSTAENVTQVSGRGVGMDAVRAFLKEHDSDIRIVFNQPGTELSFVPFTFVISLPDSVCTAGFLEVVPFV